MYFKFFLEERVLLASLRLETFTSTRLKLFLLVVQWESRTIRLKFQSFKNLQNCAFQSFIITYICNRRHSRLQYWLLLQHWHSRLLSLTHSLTLTLSLSLSLEPTFSRFFFKSDSCQVDKLTIPPLDNFCKEAISVVTVEVYTFTSIIKSNTQ